MLHTKLRWPRVRQETQLSRQAYLRPPSGQTTRPQIPWTNSLDQPPHTDSSTSTGRSSRQAQKDAARYPWILDSPSRSACPPTTSCGTDQWATHSQTPGWIVNDPLVLYSFAPASAFALFNTFIFSFERPHYHDYADSATGVGRLFDLCYYYWG